MKKLLSLKILSEIPKSFANFHSYSQKSQCFRSVHSLPRAKANNTNSISPKINGFLSNPVLAKHFVSSAHLKGSTINSLVGCSRVGFVRPHFPKAKPSPSSAPSSQHRTWSSWLQGFQTDNVVLCLVFTNAAVFVLWQFLDRDFMSKNFTISVDNFKSGRVHTLITSAFSNIDQGFLLSNMINLFFFGKVVARTFGVEYFLKLYFAGAAAGSVFHLVYHAFFADMFKKQGTSSRESSKIPGLSSSGAINAIMLLYIFRFPKATIYLNLIVPVPAVLLGIFVVGMDVLRMTKGDPHISGSVHLGGVAAATVAWLRLRRGIPFKPL